MANVEVDYRQTLSLVPVRCYTCGKPLTSTQYEAVQETLIKTPSLINEFARGIRNGLTRDEAFEAAVANRPVDDKLKELGIKRYCCISNLTNPAIVPVRSQEPAYYSVQDVVGLDPHIRRELDIIEQSTGQLTIERHQPRGNFQDQSATAKRVSRRSTIYKDVFIEDNNSIPPISDNNNYIPVVQQSSGPRRPTVRVARDIGPVFSNNPNPVPNPRSPSRQLDVTGVAIPGIAQVGILGQSGAYNQPYASNFLPQPVIPSQGILPPASVQTFVPNPVVSSGLTLAPSLRPFRGLARAIQTNTGRPPDSNPQPLSRLPTNNVVLPLTNPSIFPSSAPGLPVQQAPLLSQGQQLQGQPSQGQPSQGQLPQLSLQPPNLPTRVIPQGKLVGGLPIQQGTLSQSLNNNILSSTQQNQVLGPSTRVIGYKS